MNRKDFIDNSGPGLVVESPIDKSYVVETLMSDLNLEEAFKMFHVSRQAHRTSKFGDIDDMKRRVQDLICRVIDDPNDNVEMYEDWFLVKKSYEKIGNEECKDMGKVYGFSVYFAPLYSSCVQNKETRGKIKDAVEERLRQRGFVRLPPDYVTAPGVNMDGPLQMATSGVVRREAVQPTIAWNAEELRHV